MADDLVKGKDNEFYDQTMQFHAFIAANAADYGFTADDVSDLLSKNTTFGASLTDYNKKDTAARAARQQKDIDRDPAEDQFRWMAKQFNSRPNVTNADRINAGLPPRAEGSTGKTPDFSTPPMLLVEQAGIHGHLIWSFMQSEQAKSTKLPANVDGVELFKKIGGEPSTNIKDYQPMVFDRKPPYNYEHDPEDAGKMAHYIGVWATDDQQRSSQSEVFSLMIT